MQRISVLLKPYGLAVIDSPDMHKLSALRNARRFVSAGVVSQRHDCVARIEQLVDLHTEPVPFTDAACKHAVEDRFRSDVWIPIRIGEVVRFVPLYLLVHASEYRGHITNAKRVIDSLHDFFR